MVRHLAVLGLAALSSACTQEIVIQDLLDASDHDARVTRDIAPSGGDDAWCPTRWQPLNYDPRVAQLLIAFDRSAGMQTVFGGGGTTRADAAEFALMDAIYKYQTRVRFGFEQFPADSTDTSYGECQRNTCCAGSVKVPPNWNNASSIKSFLQCGNYGFPCPYPSYETASHAALQKVREHYRSHPPEPNNDPYVLLVTGSEPYCSSLPAGTDACEQALDAANDLGELGVRLIVVSVGYQPTSTSCLVRLADTGSKLPVPSGMKTLYTPPSVSSLNAAVAEIALTLARTTCTMESSDTPPPDQAKITISVGPTDIPQVDSTSQSGWSFANAAHTRIVLSGASCDLFVYSRENEVSAGYYCPK